MKYIYIILLLISSLGFAENRKDIAMVDRHINDFAAKFKKDGYYLFGNGGEMMGNIQKVCLDFELHKHVEISEARKRIVQLAEEFMRIINEDEVLRPYLNNYPFVSKNVGFSIMFKDQNGDPYGDLALVMILGDQIIYSNNPGPKKPFKTILRENYLEAQKCVKEGTEAPKPLEMKVDPTDKPKAMKVFEIR